MIIEKYIQHKNETSLNVTQSRIDSLRKKDITKTGIRVYDKGFIGVAGALGEFNSDALIKEALENKLEYAGKPSEAKEKNLLCENNLMEDDTFLQEMEDYIDKLHKTQPNFIFSNKINLVNEETTLKNDAGLQLYHKDRYLYLELLFKEKSSINLIDGYIPFYGRQYDQDNLINFSNSMCNAYLNKVDIPKQGTYPVVFSNYNSPIMIKFINELNGKNFATGSSLLHGKIGSKLFSDNFSLLQSNNPLHGFSTFFDGEGTINENYTYELIKNGVLMTPYTDKGTSLKYNLPLTGAASSDYDSTPDIGYPNLIIKESEKSLKEILGGEKAIFVVLSEGGDFTPKGDFATPVQLAFLFDGEHFLGRLPELQVSSNLYDMFGASFRGAVKDSLNKGCLVRYTIMDMKVSKL